MKGVEFLIDEQGEKKAVLIDLRQHRDLWDDFYDTLKTIERKKEPRETMAEVRKKVLQRS
jgi:hypothetical protein